MESVTVKGKESDDTNRATAHLPYHTDQWSPMNKNGKKVYSKEFLMALRKDPKSNKKPKNIPAELLANENKKPIKKTSRVTELFPNFNYDFITSAQLSAALKNISSNNDKIPALNVSSSTVGKNSAENILPLKCVDSKKIPKVVPASLILCEPHATAVQPKKEAKTSDDTNAKDKFNLTPVADLLHKDNKNPESNKKLTPVEIENNNGKLSSNGNTKINQISNDFLVATKNEPQEPAMPRVPKPHSVEAASSVTQQPSTSQGIPINPSLRKIRNQTHNLYAGIAPLSNQTQQMATHTQGEALFQWPSTTPLQPTMHYYGSTSTPVQYLSSGPQAHMNYIFPRHHPTQSNVYQYLQQGVAACKPQSNIATNRGVSAEASTKVPCQSINILEEYLNGQCSIQEVQQKIKTSSLASVFPQAITNWCLYVLEKSKKARLQTGFLFAKLIKLGSLSVEDYCGNLEVLLKNADELAIDIPSVWDYVAELVFPVLCEGAIETKNLHKLFNLLIKITHAAKLLARLFKLMITENEESSSLTFADYTAVAVASNACKIQTPTTSAPEEQVPNQLKARLNKLFEEYLNDRCSVQECLQHIRIFVPPSEIAQLVSLGSMSALTKSKISRLRTGFLFAQLIKLNILSIPNYCVGLEVPLEKASEMVIETPKVWCYLAELISPVLCENAVTLRNLHDTFKLLISNNCTSELLNCLFKLIIQEKGIAFLQSIWNSSGFTFADYMAESQVNSFVKENNLEFLLKPGESTSLAENCSPDQNHMSYNEIYEKLIAFFKCGTSCANIIYWITQKVGGRVKENQFIRTLATACFSDSIVNLKLKPDVLQEKYKLLHRFVNNKPAYELECLFALQALTYKLGLQGLLLAICDKLYEENVFSHESFIAWEASNDPAEQEGKGVALKQLTSFFTQLKEADEDSSSSEDAHV